MFGRCPTSPTGRHVWVKWKNEKHPNTGTTHGPGEHIILHCRHCGAIK